MYRLGGAKDNLGYNTVYFQQYRSLRRKDFNQTNPQKEFDKNLCSQLRRWRLKNCYILLEIDANAGLEDPQINQIVSAGNLYDILGSHHGIDSPPTYLKGTKTIDFLFGTRNV